MNGQVGWIETGMEYLEENLEVVRKSFLVCGITNSLDGSENSLILCARDIQLPYTNLSDDPFCEEFDDDEPNNDDDESDTASDSD